MGTTGCVRGVTSVRVLSFRLCGKMAHFRRYYSNSSALTYSIPPRTTVTGILAGLLGYERDRYYNEFSLDECQIAVAIGAPIKKVVQKLNLLMIKKWDDMNGSQENHSQTATEFVLPQNIRDGHIDYWIYVAHRNLEIMKRLENLLKNEGLWYQSKAISLGLGTAYCLGWLQYEGVWEGQDESSTEPVDLDTVIPVRLVKKLDIQVAVERGYRLVKEDLPLEFDERRQLTNRGKGCMLINLNEFPIRATVEQYTRLSNGQNIVWMQ
jgi:CRISPR-associated protein Cas5h